LIARQLGEDSLGGVRGAVDAIDDREVPAVTFGQVSYEREVVVGFPVEAEGVQAPERERGVADPAIAVVPVPLAARGLGQGRGGRRRDGTDRGERQALEGQRAPGQTAAPAVARGV